MNYARIINSIVNVTVMPPSTTSRTLRSGNSYVTVSPVSTRGRRNTSAPPTNSRGRSVSISSRRGRPPSRGRARSTSTAGRGRSRSASARPAAVPRVTRPRRSRSTSTPRPAATRPSPVNTPVPVVQSTPPFDSEALRDAMEAKMGGPFDSDDESEDDVPEADGMGDGRDTLVFTPPPPAPSLYSQDLISRRGFANPPPKAQSYLFERMTRCEKKNDPSFELLTTSCGDSERLFDGLNSKAFEFGNAMLMSAIIATGGTGAFLQKPPSVLKDFELGNYLDLHNPFKIYEESECNFVSMDTVVKMAGLVNGGDDARFQTPVKVNGFYVYEPVDPNLPGRRGELNRLKITARNASQSLLMWLKNNMKYQSWRSVQLRCMDKRFRCILTNQIIECGEIWLKELTMSVVPSTMMRGLGFKVEFDNYSFDKAGLNPAVYFDHQDEMQNKANITMGPNTITDQRYLEKTWLDLDKEDPVENVPLFSHAVMIGKNEWANSTPETAKSKQEIVGELLNVYRNHVAEKAWNPVVRSSAEKARLVAFTAKVEQEKNKLVQAANALKKAEQSLKQKSSAVSTASSGDVSTKSKDSKGSKASTAYDDKGWRTTNKGPESIHPKTGEKFLWCSKGHGGGCYMPVDHDHEAWAAAKAEKRNNYYANKRAGDDGNAKPPAKKVDNGKLKLSNDLAQAALTSVQKTMKEQMFMTDAEIEQAMGIKQESKE